MKFGCCLNMVAGQPDKTGAEHLESLARAEFDYVELPLAEMMELPEDRFTALCRRVESVGVPCLCCNNFFPPSRRLTGAEREPLGAVMDYVERALDRAAGLGVQRVVFGSGGAKNVPEGFPLEEGFRQVAELLSHIGPSAADREIVIAIEPLRKQECNLINTFAEGCRLSRAVSHPNVRVLVDYYHLREEGEPLEHVAAEGRDFLRHVHWANPVGRVYPARGDGQDYTAFASALWEAGYDGTVSCEAYSRDVKADMEQTMELCRQIFLREA